MCRTPEPCPVCQDGHGFHFGHRFQIPTDWRYDYAIEENNGWIAHVYRDPQYNQHRVVTKHWSDNG